MRPRRRRPQVSGVYCISSSGPGYRRVDLRGSTLSDGRLRAMGNTREWRVFLACPDPVAVPNLCSHFYVQAPHASISFTRLRPVSSPPGSQWLRQCPNECPAGGPGKLAAAVGRSALSGGARYRRADLRVCAEAWSATDVRVDIPGA